MTRLYWNGVAFAPLNKGVSDQVAVALADQNAVATANVIAIERYRGRRYLQRNGFAVCR